MPAGFPGRKIRGQTVLVGFWPMDRLTAIRVPLARRLAGSALTPCRGCCNRCRHDAERRSTQDLPSLESARLPLPHALGGWTIAVWRAAPAKNAADMARSRPGVASRSAWRLVRVYPYECGGHGRAAPTTVGRHARHLSMDNAQRSVTAGTLIPRSASRLRSQCQLASANASTASPIMSRRAPSPVRSWWLDGGQMGFCWNGSVKQITGGRAW
jgi:hypothetical protein